jgi:molybdopterin biosynthesis enzyme
MEAELIVVSGANALDPLDPVFVALEQMGATMLRSGVPVHPGTLLWVATLGAATIIGLPSCGRGMGVTAFDLVLPKLLAQGTIRDEDLAALGHGGILR